MKIGTIGSGVIVDRFIEAINLVDGVELVGVYSRTQERADAFAKEHNAKKAFASIEAMLQDDSIDTIYIASPNSLHFPQSLQCLKAKKNVICEKPFTSTLEEVDTLIKTAKENNVFIFEAITNIHLPNFKIVKDRLNSLGNMRLVTCNFSQFSSKYPAYAKHEHANVFDPAFSGGALMDINIYNIHLTVGLFGKPESYTYYPNLGYNGIDTSGTLIMKYANFIATLIGAKDCSSDNFAFFQGDEGTIKIDGASTGVCKDVSFLPVKGDPIGVKGPQDSNHNLGIEQKQHMSYEVEAFYNIVKNNDIKAYESLLQHSRDVMEIMYHARINAGITFDADKNK